MAEDKATALNDVADHAPASFTPAGAGLSKPRRQVSKTGAVALGFAALAAVGVVAAFTGGGSSTTYQPIAGAVHAGPLPPQVVFDTATDGYSFSSDCVRAQAGDDCAPAMNKTTDGGKTWSVVALPAGLPTSNAGWGRLQVSGQDLLLPYTYGSIVSHDGGATWNTVLSSGSISAVPKDVLVLSQGAVPSVVNPAKASSSLLSPEGLVITTPLVGAKLPNGAIWVRDPHQIAFSHNQGQSWQSTALTRPWVETVHSQINGKHIVRLSGPPEGTTLGEPGDGGELATTLVMISDASATQWSSTVITGPMVNAECTVMMANGALLGVAVDGSGLLELTPGATAFTPVKTNLPSTPVCLQSNNTMMWGTTFNHHVVFSADGKTWTAANVPPPLDNSVPPAK